MKSNWLRSSLIATACGVACLAAVGSKGALATELELMHFFTSGGEAAAMNAIKEAAQKEGIEWKDAAVAGGSGMNAYQVLQARIAAGNPPGAMQMHGAQIRQYAEGGLLLDMSEVATAEKWEGLLDPNLIPWMKYNGEIVGVPFNIHRPNWIWANKALIDKYGGKVPATWDEFYAMGDKMKADGIIPLATGGQAWQELLLWDLVVVGSQGKEFHKAALEDQNMDAIKGPQMLSAFETFRKVLSYSDANRANRDWNLATAMVMKGEAAMQIMGDWALGEFLNAKLESGKDYICAESPGTAGLFVWNTDYWGFFKGMNAEGATAQKALAKVTMDKDVQEKFNVLKGSIPARTDIGPEAFQPCGQKAVADRAAALKSGNMVPSFSQNAAVSTEIRGVYEDAVNQFANDPNMTPQQAVDKIVSGLQEL